MPESRNPPIDYWHRIEAYERIISRLSGLITPYPKRAALENDQIFIEKCLFYFRERGAPANIERMINWLDAEGATCRIYKANNAKSVARDHNTIRLLLRKYFNISGTSGRKKSILPNKAT